MSRDRTALFYMSISVLATSTIPLIIILVNGGGSPFLFTLIWRGAGVLGILVALCAFFRQTLTDHTAKTLILRTCRSWAFALMCVAELSFLLYVLSFDYIDPAVATILYGASPIVVIVAGTLLFRAEGRFDNTTMGIALPLCVAFSGMALLTFSQIGHSGIAHNAPGIGAQLSGLVMAILGATLAGLRIALHIKVASQFRSDYRGSASASGDDLELFAILVFTVVASALSLPAFAIGSLATGELVEGTMLVMAGASGLLVSSVERIVFRKANLLTSNLGVNALTYVAPILALTWLFAFSLAGDMRIDYLVIGASAIIAGNLLINFQAEIRFCSRSLIVALWARGAFAHFRETLAERVRFIS